VSTRSFERLTSAVVMDSVRAKKPDHSVVAETEGDKGPVSVMGMFHHLKRIAYSDGGSDNFLFANQPVS
jgi:hypothetical protein